MPLSVSWGHISLALSDLEIREALQQRDVNGVRVGIAHRSTFSSFRTLSLIIVVQIGTIQLFSAKRLENEKESNYSNERINSTRI